jgi:hypothetical protein
MHSNILKDHCKLEIEGLELVVAPVQQMSGAGAAALASSMLEKALAEVPRDLLAKSVAEGKRMTAKDGSGSRPLTGTPADEITSPLDDDDTPLSASIGPSDHTTGGRDADDGMLVLSGFVEQIVSQTELVVNNARFRIQHQPKSSDKQTVLVVHLPWLEYSDVHAEKDKDATPVGDTKSPPSKSSADTKQPAAATSSASPPPKGVGVTSIPISGTAATGGIGPKYEYHKAIRFHGFRVELFEQFVSGASMDASFSGHSRHDPRRPGSAADYKVASTPGGGAVATPVHSLPLRDAGHDEEKEATIIHGDVDQNCVILLKLNMQPAAGVGPRLQSTCFIRSLRALLTPRHLALLTELFAAIGTSSALVAERAVQLREAVLDARENVAAAEAGLGPRERLARPGRNIPIGPGDEARMDQLFTAALQHDRESAMRQEWKDKFIPARGPNGAPTGPRKNTAQSGRPRGPSDALLDDEFYDCADDLEMKRTASEDSGGSNGNDVMFLWSIKFELRQCSVTLIENDMQRWPTDWWLTPVSTIPPRRLSMDRLEQEPPVGAEVVGVTTDHLLFALKNTIIDLSQTSTASTVDLTISSVELIEYLTSTLAAAAASAASARSSIRGGTSSLPVRFKRHALISFGKEAGSVTEGTRTSRSHTSTDINDDNNRHDSDDHEMRRRRRGGLPGERKRSHSGDDDASMSGKGHVEADDRARGRSAAEADFLDTVASQIHPHFRCSMRSALNGALPPYLRHQYAWATDQVTDDEADVPRVRSRLVLDFQPVLFELDLGLGYRTEAILQALSAPTAYLQRTMSGSSSMLGMARQGRAATLPTAGPSTTTAPTPSNPLDLLSETAPRSHMIAETDDVDQSQTIIFAPRITVRIAFPAPSPSNDIHVDEFGWCDTRGPQRNEQLVLALSDVRTYNSHRMDAIAEDGKWAIRFESLSAYLIYAPTKLPSSIIPWQQAASFVERRQQSILQEIMTKKIATVATLRDTHMVSPLITVLVRAPPSLHFQPLTDAAPVPQPTQGTSSAPPSLSSIPPKHPPSSSGHHGHGSRGHATAVPNVHIPAAAGATPEDTYLNSLHTFRWWSADGQPAELKATPHPLPKKPPTAPASNPSVASDAGINGHTYSAAFEKGCIENSATVVTLLLPSAAVTVTKTEYDLLMYLLQVYQEYVALPPAQRQPMSMHAQQELFGGAHDPLFADMEPVPPQSQSLLLASFVPQPQATRADVRRAFEQWKREQEEAQHGQHHHGHGAAHESKQIVAPPSYAPPVNPSVDHVTEPFSLEDDEANRRVVRFDHGNDGGATINSPLASGSTSPRSADAPSSPAFARRSSGDGHNGGMNRNDSLQSLVTPRSTGTAPVTPASTHSRHGSGNNEMFHSIRSPLGSGPNSGANSAMNSALFQSARSMTTSSNDLFHSALPGAASRVGAASVAGSDVASTMFASARDFHSIIDAHDDALLRTPPMSNRSMSRTNGNAITASPGETKAGEWKLPQRQPGAAPSTTVVTNPSDTKRSPGLASATSHALPAGPPAGGRTSSTQSLSDAEVSDDETMVSRGPIDPMSASHTMHSSQFFQPAASLPPPALAVHSESATSSPARVAPIPRHPVGATTVPHHPSSGSTATIPPSSSRPLATSPPTAARPAPVASPTHTTPAPYRHAISLKMVVTQGTLCLHEDASSMAVRPTTAASSPVAAVAAAAAAAAGGTSVPSSTSGPTAMAPTGPQTFLIDLREVRLFQVGEFENKPCTYILVRAGDVLLREYQNVAASDLALLTTPSLPILFKIASHEESLMLKVNEAGGGAPMNYRVMATGAGGPDGTAAGAVQQADALDSRDQQAAAGSAWKNPVLIATFLIKEVPAADVNGVNLAQSSLSSSMGVGIHTLPTTGTIRDTLAVVNLRGLAFQYFVESQWPIRLGAFFQPPIVTIPGSPSTSSLPSPPMSPSSISSAPSTAPIPKDLIKVFANAFDCAIDYNPTPILSRAVLACDSIAISTTIYPDSTLYAFKIVLRDGAFYMINRSLKLGYSPAPAAQLRDLGLPCLHRLVDESLFAHLETQGFARVATLDYFEANIATDIAPPSFSAANPPTRPNLAVECNNGLLTLYTCNDSFLTLTELAGHLATTLIAEQKVAEIDVAFADADGKVTKPPPALLSPTPAPPKLPPPSSRPPPPPPSTTTPSSIRSSVTSSGAATIPTPMQGHPRFRTQSTSSSAPTSPSLSSIRADSTSTAPTSLPSMPMIRTDSTSSTTDPAAGSSDRDVMRGIDDDAFGGMTTTTTTPPTRNRSRTNSTGSGSGSRPSSRRGSLSSEDIGANRVIDDYPTPAKPRSLSMAAVPSRGPPSSKPPPPPLAHQFSGDGPTRDEPEYGGFYPPSTYSLGRGSDTDASDSGSDGDHPSDNDNKDSRERTRLITEWRDSKRVTASSSSGSIPRAIRDGHRPVRSYSLDSSPLHLVEGYVRAPDRDPTAASEQIHPPKDYPQSLMVVKLLGISLCWRLFAGHDWPLLPTASTSSSTTVGSDRKTASVTVGSTIGSPTTSLPSVAEEVGVHQYDQFSTKRPLPDTPILPMWDEDALMPRPAGYGPTTGPDFYGVDSSRGPTRPIRPTGTGLDAFIVDDVAVVSKSTPPTTSSSSGTGRRGPPSAAPPPPPPTGPPKRKSGRQTDRVMELHVIKANMRMDTYGPRDQIASRIAVAIQDIEVHGKWRYSVRC